MTIHLAADHAGFEHKEMLKAYLLEKGHDVIDHGATLYDANDDYPEFITPCAEAVGADTASLGIVFGGSGQGEAMCANRIKGVRATVYYGGTQEILTLSKEHNNANMLSIGARFVSAQETLEIVEIWLSSSFTQDERHIRRLSKF